jgi:hypothetical protein
MFEWLLRLVLGAHFVVKTETLKFGQGAVWQGRRAFEFFRFTMLEWLLRVGNPRSVVEKSCPALI